VFLFEYLTLRDIAYRFLDIAILDENLRIEFKKALIGHNVIENMIEPYNAQYPMTNYGDRYFSFLNWLIKREISFPVPGVFYLNITEESEIGIKSYPEIMYQLLRIIGGKVKNLKLGLHYIIQILKQILKQVNIIQIDVCNLIIFK
jgi:hypothetical protein